MLMILITLIVMATIKLWQSHEHNPSFEPCTCITTKLRYRLAQLLHLSKLSFTRLWGSQKTLSSHGRRLWNTYASLTSTPRRPCRVYVPCNFVCARIFSILSCCSDMDRFGLSFLFPNIIVSFFDEPNILVSNHK